MAPQRPSPLPDPEEIALQALGFLASDEERLERFLGTTGLGPDTIRESASQPGFLAAVLDHLAADEALLLTFAANHRLDPEAISIARQKLAGPGVPL
ncbi:MAG: DUF3572 domain-containing protein [Chelatococcus sp.]|uniref:DUF3572 domain-containing protein n=1 Tax=unclassified Chelatococcus TaxID=2638111 RepID=UPI001BCD078A|nr:MULTISPECIES: DUF3572 domain-containing protein [unclassified Chelatococcus]CAH1669639.1 conserved hypothetical protein [Hyphomicrobiales bacterium]MBS7738233.1 DUF3572 domain-containing protein [Chelatococcus sp. HY11]MBX3539655.1 DUF3572 domain-containing protein [Chelatococcus sp.]MBX3545761.1 DUF3572 domain-containing protein [Chelatococcus sp.]MCO5077421.1 DUF3572 domain-containing protein [Chelatococcus sp.]